MQTDSRSADACTLLPSFFYSHDPLNRLHFYAIYIIEQKFNLAPEFLLTYTSSQVIKKVNKQVKLQSKDDYQH